MVNIEEELKVFENSVRDILTFVLSKKYGVNWTDHLKIPTERIIKWKERRETENKRLKGKILDDRLIYYSDFYDLKSIITKHWEDGFSDVFDAKKTVEVFLEEAEKLRDPNAHRRELFEYQKYLVKGMSAELRTRIMKYRGKMENPDDYFPILEAVTTTCGTNVSITNYAQVFENKSFFRVGDSIEIIAHSIDPLGGEIEYSIDRIGNKNWSKENRRIITFQQEDIGRACDIQIMVRSMRNYHAYRDYDYYIAIRYSVLPE